MRIVFAILISLIAGTAFNAAAVDTARADPYRWCANYGGEDGGTNCYFITLDQCRLNVSGAGGFCTQNPFYDGKPIVTPVAIQPVKKKPQPRN